MNRLIGAIALVGLASGCSDKKKPDDKPDEGQPKSTEPAIPDVELRPLGVESPRVFSFRWGNGRKAYEKARELSGVAKPDWKAVAAACGSAVAVDPNHFSAHRLCGVARAKTGEGKRALEHFSIALAADWKSYGEDLESDQLLAKFLETPEGKALARLNRAYEKGFKSAAAGGVLVVAKRSRFKMPDKTGDLWAGSRAEIYSYSIETDRYLRISHTAESILGYVRSPDGARIAYLRASRYRFPEEGETGEPRFLDARVGVLDADTFEQIGEDTRLKEPSVALMLQYGAAGELTLQTRDPDVVYSVDFEGGNLNASSADPLDDFETLYRRTWTGLAQPALYADIRMARVLHPSAPVGSVNSRQLKLASGKSIRLPDDGGESIRRPRLSPGGKHVAFVGVGECAGGKAPDTALYVADLATGTPLFIHRGKALHDSRWADGDRLLFDAGPGELRLYDLREKRVTQTIKNRAGIAFDAVSNAVATEHCPPPPAAPVAPIPPANSSDAGVGD